MESSPPFDLVCIGSGPAGQRAAVQAAKLGKRALVIEKARCFGGVCMDTGTVPSKTFREAVVALRKGPARPTAAALLERVARVVQRETEVVADQLGRNRVELLSGEASFVDPHTLEVRGTTGSVRVRGERILVAVGTRPAPPPHVPVDGRTIWCSDDVLMLQEIPRSLTVVGAGVIGIEYACMFAALRVEVTLVDQRERLLEFLDREIVDELTHQMRSAGVTFRLGEKVEALEVSAATPPRAIVQLESGKRLVSDAVLFSVGRVGATDALNLAAAGLEADARGRLAVDERFRTAVPHIMAAGDVIGFPSLASTSGEQGRLAACHAFGVDAAPMPPHFPIGIYGMPEMSMVGRPEHELTADRIPYETGIARYREIARGQILGDDSGLLKLIFHREDRRLLGVHAIGTNATELIHIGQAVLRLGGGLGYFLETVFNYPTLAECYKVAALDAYNKLALH